MTDGDAPAERPEAHSGAERPAERWDVVPDPGQESATATGIEAESGSEETSVPAELRTVFWLLVVLIKLTVIAASLGVLLIWFQGRWLLGGGLLGLAAVLALAAFVRYRRYRLAQNQHSEEASLE